jgi:hypothetical protein
MRLYKLNINEENKVWRKYFTFAENFICNKEEIKSTDFILKKPPLNNVEIQALNNGNVIRNELFFTKEKMPEFCKIENIFLIKEDIFDYEIFSNLKGINFMNIKVYGNFSKDYKLLTFSTAIDCIDEVNSKRGSFEFLSTLVLDELKIPTQLDGFFLKNWNRYGKYDTIINEETKEALLSLYKAKDFLIFKEISISK